MTAGGHWLSAAEALAAGWMKARRCVDACQLVLIVEVYPSVGRSWEAPDRGLKALIGLMVKSSCLEVPDRGLSTCM